MSAGDEDSVRSHAVSGILYISCGGGVFTFALLLIEVSAPFLGVAQGQFASSSSPASQGLLFLSGFVQLLNVVQRAVAYLFLVRPMENST